VPRSPRRHAGGNASRHRVRRLRTFAAAPPPESCDICGIESLTPADRRRPNDALRRPDAGEAEREPVGRMLVKAKRRTDMLKDKVAIIAAIRRGCEDQIHVTATILDDPGRDAGLDSVLGHRFFFAQHEVELLAPEMPS